MPFIQQAFYRLFFLVLLLCWGLTFPAQARQKNKNREKSAPPAQTYRSELESNSFDNEHQVHALPDSAMLLVSMKRNAWFGKNDFVLTKYDRQLKPLWESKQEHLPNSSLLFMASEKGRIYLLFSTLSSQRLLLYQVNATTGTAMASQHQLPSSNLLFKEMLALDGQVFLSGFDKLNMNMLHLNPMKEEIKLLPAVTGMEKDLGEFRVDTLTKSVESVVGESNGQRSRVQVKRMNTKGDIKGTYFIQPNFNDKSDNVLQPARLTPGDTLQKLLVGTYGYRSDAFTNGLYTSTLAGQITFFTLSKLSHFFEHMSPRGERLMKKKAASKEEKNQPILKERKLLLHPVMPHPLGFAVVGEVYNEHHTMVSKDEFKAANNRLPGYVDLRVAQNGYQFTQVIACVFDPEGNLIWDNSYKLKSTTHPTLDPTVEAGVTSTGNITLLFQKEDFVWHKTLKPNTSLTNEERVKVRLQETTEKMVTSSHQGIIHWYGGNFIAFGFQRIKPQTGTGRTVFYLQNMAFE